MLSRHLRFYLIPQEYGNKAIRDLSILAREDIRHTVWYTAVNGGVFTYASGIELRSDDTSRQSCL